MTAQRLSIHSLKPAKGVAYVGSDENISGKLQGEEIARLLNYKGNLVILVASLRPRLPCCVPKV